MRLFGREKIADRTKGSTPSTGAPTSDNDKQNPLHLAVRNGKERLVKALLEEGVDKHAEDKDGKTAFYYAVFEGKEEIARLFAADEETKGDLLLQAAGSGNAEAVNLLLDLGASPKVTGKDGNTPLYRAVFGGHMKAAKALKECIEDRDRDGDTILLKAVKLGNRKATALLLELKPIVDAKDARNKTALYNAVYRGNKSIAELLVKGHASTEALDENQDTLLHQAVREGKEAAVAILLDLHAEIGAKDSNGKTPLENSNSIENRQKGITKLLADKNADTKNTIPRQAAREGNIGARPVFNYALPSEYYYNIPSHYHPMASQRSSGSTDSSWSNTPAESYQSRDAYQAHGRAKHAASTQAPSQYPSYGTSHSTSYRQETSPPPPKTPSEKGDRDSKEPQYCWHKDCLDSSGRPVKQFTRKADVTRHHKSTHDKQFMDCPKRNCNRKGDNGFTRLDHQIEHLRGYHGEHIEKRSNTHAGRSHSRDA